MKHLKLSIFLLGFIGLVSIACSPQKTENSNLPANTYFTIQVGSVDLQLQLALNENERSQGLMFRKELEDAHGMLFVFENSTTRSFWMRNTPLPLDLAYFDSNGVLLEIYPLYPYNEQVVASHSEKIQFALEVEQGQLKVLGIKAGDQLNLSQLKDAISAREPNPERFNFQL